MNVDPDDTGDVSKLDYKYLIFRFIGRQRKLQKFKELNCPEQMIDIEEKLVQKAYNQMRDKCMADREYIAIWEN